MDAPASVQETAGRVLILEDDPSLRELLAVTLEEAGYTVESFDTGRRALDHLATAHRPDVLLVDYVLRQGMDGGHFLAELREDWQSRLPGVVLMTALDLEPNMVSRAAADAVLIKPFSLRRLLQTVGEVLERRR
jgi:DNA-binding response OmpR family regulator